ncbi:MAG: protein kinase [Clostridia bacterium]|nr:protein kinase [Clostridia bacterium]
MNEHICLSCFHDKGASRACPHCGYIETAQRKRSLLPARYVLQNRYIVGEHLSTDKNGVCYKGFDMQTQQIVEIQEHFPREIVMRADDGVTLVPLSSGDTDWPCSGVRRIYENAQTMKQYSQCEGLLHIYDAFEANRTVYVVNEYLEGMLLEDYLGQCGGAVDTDTALKIILPILDGLGQLHKNNLIHRAVTPKNIVITSDDTVKLINFVFLKESTPYTENEMTVYFSPGYAPYEQYVSKERRGPYTDIYSVGAVLYRMLLGRAPADAVARMEDDTLQEDLTGTGLPEHIVLAILKAMNMNKDRRYKSTTDMKNVLLALTPPVDVDDELNKIERRKQIAVICGLAVVLTALLALLVVTVIKRF